MWRLCDLHNHTTPNEQCGEAWDAQLFVDSCIDARLDVVAITDHDHCDHVRDAVAAAEPTSLVVIPGIEISTDLGHVLAIAPGTQGCDVIEAFRSRTGAIRDSQVRFAEVVQAFRAKRETNSSFRDEIVLIGAHVDVSGSILSTANSRSLSLQIESAKSLHALEVASAERLTEWARDGVKQSTERFALVRGSDTHDPSSRPNRSTWIYLPDVTTADLRHALAVPESSVAFSDTKPTSQSNTIEYLEISAGHHAGKRFEFSSRANAIIGSPNTGKSLLIDAFKFAFGMKCQIDEVEKISSARMSTTMPSGTVVRVGLRTSKGPTVIERTVGGSGKPHPPFRPIIFSQTELTRRSIAGAPAVQLLDIHCESIADLTQSVSEGARGVVAAFQELVEIAAQAHELSDIIRNPEDGLDVTQEAIRALSGHESIAATAMNVEKISTWQDDTGVAADAWLVSLPGPKFVVPQAPEFDGSVAGASELVPCADIEAISDAAHKQIVNFVEGARSQISGILGGAAKQLDSLRATSDAELDRHGFSEGSDLLDNSRRLQIRFGELQQQKNVHDELTEEIEVRLSALTGLLETVRTDRTAVTDARREGCTRVNHSMHSFFAIVDPVGETAIIDALFDQLKTGTNMQPNTRIRALEGLDRMRFMEYAIRELQGCQPEYSEAFADQDKVAAEAVRRGKYTEIAELACCFAGDSLDLRWKQTSPPTPFDHLTEGLRALAIKEISFAASDLPVISDQPEDAVPTRSIFSSLVPTLREQRQERQFIVVSHDANIVVTSDVEQVVVLDGAAEGALLQGSLFDPNIQTAALEHLEGGRQAFMLRSDRYGGAKVE